MQIILVYIIISAALFYTAYNIYKVFAAKDNHGCNCSGCEMKSHVNEIKGLSKTFNIK